ncbi:MAG TPA: signal peptidase II [Actinomycetota bacterium]|nr:signal peptidase II [Actinomycetota bacterium]
MARRLGVLLYSVAAAAYALDRFTKVLAEQRLQGRPPIELIPGVLQLRYTTNPGGAFGLFGGATWLFVGASVLVIVVVFFASRSVPTRATAIGLGLVLAGALGNITDRAIRGEGFSGEVVDFIDLRVWPVFNVADSSIVIGAAILILTGIRGGRAEERTAADER